MDITELPSTGDAAGPTPRPGSDLSSLSNVVLDPAKSELLASATASIDTSNVFELRMANEAREMLALGQIAPPGRLRFDWLEITETVLRALMLMQIFVPRQPDANNRLRVGNYVMLGMNYPRDAIQHAIPGAAFFDVLQPFDLWHPNVSTVGPSPIPRLCLGPELMPGIRCVDLILMAYGALGMQTLQIDEQDPAGVMNIAAARWWQQNTDRLPLTRTPFLQAEECQTVRKDSQ